MKKIKSYKQIRFDLFGLDLFNFCVNDTEMSEHYLNDIISNYLDANDEEKELILSLYNDIISINEEYEEFSDDFRDDFQNEYTRSIDIDKENWSKTFDLYTDINKKIERMRLLFGEYVEEYANEKLKNDSIVCDTIIVNMNDNAIKKQENRLESYRTDDSLKSLYKKGMELIKIKSQEIYKKKELVDICYGIMVKQNLTSK